MEVEPDGSMQYGQSVQEMYDALKNEQNLCLRDSEIGFSATIQNLLLAILQNAGRSQCRNSSSSEESSIPNFH